MSTAAEETSTDCVSSSCPRTAGEAVDAVRPGATRRDLFCITADGAAYSMMVGCGENYLAAFCLAAGLGEVVAGLIASVPLVVGAFVQLISPWAVRRLGSYRKWVVLCAAIQAASFVPLVIAGLTGGISTGLMFVVAAVYWGSGLAGGPAWNSWVATIVPARVRANYFGRRTRVMQASLLMAFLCAGAALQAARSDDAGLTAFAALFAIAGLCRLISTTYLLQQTEIGPGPEEVGESYRTTLRRLRGSAEGRLLVYLVAVQGAAQISSAFFTPYMISQLGFSYATYALVVATSLATKTLTAPFWGWFAHRFGVRRLLQLGGIAVMPLPGLWIFGSSLSYLMLVQVLAGASWAAYELAASLTNLESIRAGHRTNVLTILTTVHSLATVGGALLGGAIIGWLGEIPYAYLTVFGISSLARLATWPLLFRLNKGEAAADDDISEPVLLPMPVRDTLPVVVREKRLAS